MEKNPANFLEKLKTAIASGKWFEKSEGILLGVSGGVDSMVLMEALQRLAAEDGWKLTVAHFNHQLRGKQSDADERLVRKVAKKLKLPCVVGRGSVKAEAKRRGWSIEMAARELRHRFLTNAAKKVGTKTIALAHHQDDQVELFFLRLFRGAGGEGLAGMRVESPSPIDASISLVRPLLNFSKAELREFAVANKIPFSEDETNASPDFLRNRIRLKLLPFLREEFGTNLDATVLRTMEIVGAENEVVRAFAEEWRKEKHSSGSGIKGEDPLSPKVFASSPPSREKREKPQGARQIGWRPALWSELSIAIQRQVIQSQLFELGAPVDFELVERLRKQPDEPVTIQPGKCATHDGAGNVNLEKAASNKHLGASIKIRLDGSGSTTFGGVLLKWESVKRLGASFGLALNTEQFDADSIGESIVLRHWQPGDRIRLIGAEAARKLQDIFTDLKMPKQERRRRVVATTADGEIFWVQGVRIGEIGKLRGQTKRRFILQWKEL